MTTLFSSVISFHYEGSNKWALQNVLLADGVDWWPPQNPEEAGEWQSRVKLSERFFNECVEHKLPFNMRAIRALRQSPLALDISELQFLGFHYLVNSVLAMLLPMNCSNIPCPNL